MSRELIRVEGVDRAFGPVTVLEDINLMVNEGDRIGIVGHNGAGKTTLLNTISEQKQDVGEIEFANGIRITTSLRLEILTMTRQSRKSCLAKVANFRNWKRKLRQ